MKRLLSLLAAFASPLALHAAVLSGSPEPGAFSSRLDGPLQERMLDMTTDQAGNVYVVGSFTSGANGGTGMVVETFADDPATTDGTVRVKQTRTLLSVGAEDLFVAKYDPLGNLLWVRSAGGTGNDYATGVASDANGITSRASTAAPGTSAARRLPLRSARCPPGGGA